MKLEMFKQNSTLDATRVTAMFSNTFSPLQKENWATT